MKILVDKQTGFAKVIEPAFGSQNIYLDETILDYLKSEKMLEKLENMSLTIDFYQERWEILDAPPVGVPGTIASVIFHVGGSLKRSGNDMVCISNKL